MNDKIDNHPTINYHKEIQTICDPLNKLGINYFCHVNIQNNQFAAISNHPDFHRCYFEKNYQNADIHMSNIVEQKKHIIWDEIQLSGKSEALDDDAIRFGIHHSFTMHHRDEQGTHYYHFATSNRDREFNNVYLENLDLINLFINKFRYTAYNSTALSDAYGIKFSIDENQGAFENKNTNIDLDIARHEFLHDLLKDKVFPLENGNVLTVRHLIILYWLNHGKTINDISRLLNSAEVTVHKHVNNLKNQINCYTQFQLGAFFSSLPPDLIQVIRTIIDR